MIGSKTRLRHPTKCWEWKSSEYMVHGSCHDIGTGHLFTPAGEVEKVEVEKVSGTDYPKCGKELGLQWLVCFIACSLRRRQF
jgi:hypothetical protein